MRNAVAVVLACAAMIAGCARAEIRDDVKPTKKAIPAETTKASDKTESKGFQLPLPFFGGSPKKQIPEGEVGVVYFAFDKAEIRPAAGDELKRLALELRGLPKDKVVVVEGHCDNRGTFEYNIGLGHQRADAVRGYLKAMGVPGNQIQRISYGEERPVCRELNRACHAKNRRGVVIVQ